MPTDTPPPGWELVSGRGWERPCGAWWWLRVWCIRVGGIPRYPGEALSPAGQACAVRPAESLAEACAAIEKAFAAQLREAMEALEARTPPEPEREYEGYPDA